MLREMVTTPIASQRKAIAAAAIPFVNAGLEFFFLGGSLDDLSLAAGELGKTLGAALVLYLVTFQVSNRSSDG